ARGIAENPVERAIKDWKDLLKVIRKLRGEYTMEISNYLSSNGLSHRDLATQKIAGQIPAPPSAAEQSAFVVTRSENWQVINFQYTVSGSTANHQYVTIKPPDGPIL
ncbi:MAG: hypothetical protein ABH878_03030, partial [bacterium]